MVTRKIILILVSTTKFDLLSFMPKTVFYNLRNPFSTVFSLKIFEPFIAPLVIVVFRVRGTQRKTH